MTNARPEFVTRVAKSDSASSLESMSWQAFEGLVQESFRLQVSRCFDSAGRSG